MLWDLHLMTKNNILRLGNSHWIQLKGTDTGTSPASTYAKVFYVVFELYLLEIFGKKLLLHIRKIEYVLALWKRYDGEHNAEEMRDLNETIQ